MVCVLAHERNKFLQCSPFALFHHFLVLFGKPTEFQDGIRTGRPVLVFGNDSQLKLCQTIVWKILSVKEAPTQAQGSPPGSAGSCKGTQSYWQPRSPSLHISWHRAFAKPPECSSQLTSHLLFCHRVGSKEMLWGGICQKTFPGLSASGKIWLQEKGKISQSGSTGSGILCVCSSRQ